MDEVEVSADRLLIFLGDLAQGIVDIYHFETLSSTSRMVAQRMSRPVVEYTSCYSKENREARATARIKYDFTTLPVPYIRNLLNIKNMHFVFPTSA